MTVIFRRELKALLASPMGCVLIAGFVAAMGLMGLFVVPSVAGRGDWFSAKDISMDMFFSAFPWVAAAVMPAVSMRAWAEEYRAGTFQLLMTLPVRTSGIVLGKFLALGCFLLILLAATCVFPIMVVVVGTSNEGYEAGPIFGGYAACVLLGAAFIAIGMFVSALTNNQIIAFIGAFVVCGALTAWGTFAGVAVEGGGGAAASVLRYVWVAEHFRWVAAGYIRVESVVYFISLAALALTLNGLAVEGKRYR